MTYMETMYIIHDESNLFAHRIRRNPDAPDHGIQLDYTEDYKKWEQVTVIGPKEARLMAQALNRLADEMEK